MHADRDGAEFIGQSRALRDRIAAGAAISGPMMKRIYADASQTFIRRRRHRHQAGFREDYLLEIEQRWRRIPASERLHLFIERSKNHLTILDVRAGSMTVSSTQWGSNGREHDVVVVSNRLTLAQTECRADSAIMATFSLHALRRRFRRGWDNNSAAVMTDLGVLATVAWPDHPTPNFAVQAPAGHGEWRGAITLFQDLENQLSLVFSVRTFV